MLCATNKPSPFREQALFERGLTSSLVFGSSFLLKLLVVGDGKTNVSGTSKFTISLFCSHCTGEINPSGKKERKNI